MRFDKDPLEDGKSRLSLVDWMGSDFTVVDAARVSYNRDEEHDAFTVRDERLLYYLASHGHTSPFEHCVITFMVKCPIFVARQWMRHRTFSYNELSRRYTSEEIDFYIPSSWRAQDEENRQGSKDALETSVPSLWLKTLVDAAVEHYNDAIEIGVAREQARMFLPQNLYTRFYVTGNLHNWVHFIKLRDHEDAQWEIRRYAAGIREMLQELYPVSMEALFREGVRP